jgi:ligand-binding sensor domain-containing protein/signal transduction histidine kinase
LTRPKFCSIFPALNPILHSRRGFHLCRLILPSLALLILPLAAMAAGVQQYYARTWQEEEGLPHSTITSIVQAPDGYLWLGTPFGIIRFDGLTFTPMPIPALPDSAKQRIRVLYDDNAGNVWVGTGIGGLLRYDGREFHLLNEQNGLPSDSIAALGEDSQGNLWLDAQGSGLCWLDASRQVHRVRGQASLPRRFVASQILRDGSGRMWFAGWSRYGQLVNGAITNVVQATNSCLFSLCTSRDGGIWVCDESSLHKIAPVGVDDPKTTSLPIPKNISQVRTIMEDRDGGLWLGSAGRGVYRWAAGQFKLAMPSSQRIFCLYQDREGNVWVGTDGGGLSRLKPRIFSVVGVPQGLPNSTVLSVCEDQQGTVWLSPRGPGLARWNGTNVTEPVADLATLDTTTVLPAPDNGVWVGTVQRGLYLVRDGRARRMPGEYFLDGLQIRTLFADASHNLWIGCLPGGLAKLSGDKFTPPDFFTKQGLPNSAIWAMTSDARSNLWIGTIKGDLFRYDGSHFVKFSIPDGLPGASISALHADASGALWIGTLGGGLGRYQHGHFVFADTQRGLDNDAISAIVDDGTGYFWLASESGISRVSKTDLDAFADGQLSRIECTHYGQNDGLGNIHSAGGYQPAAWKTRAGEIWFATSKGAIFVNPASLRVNPYPPTLMLQQILVNGVPATNSTHLKLPHGYRDLEFQYTAANFTSPERVRFRRQLVGLNAAWEDAGQARSASYPRLAPGNYVFRFTACNSDGVWNEQPVSVAFVVTPAYWQTAWFRVLALLAFTGAVAYGVRYRYVRKMRLKLSRLEQAHAIERERMRIARDIHDDLGARLTQMAFLSEMSVKETGANGKLGALLEKIAHGSRQSIRSLEEIVWAVNPSKDSLPHLVDYLSHYANEFFRDTDIRCRQDLPLIIPEIPLSAEMRHHLFLACKEALNNIRKHSRATEVWLRVAIAGDELRLVIEDNGVGFARPVGEPAGNGLLNLQNRLAGLGGRCEITSQPGRGTQVLLAIKPPPADDNHSDRKQAPGFNPQPKN